LSNGKASRRKDTADALRDINKQKRNFNAASRRTSSGTGPVSFGSVSSNFGVSVGSNNDIRLFNGLSVGGGVMMGPIAYNPQERTLASDVLTLTDITGIINPGSSWTIVSSQDSNADNLVTINGAAFSGQILYLQAKNQEITLKTTGNIHTNDNADVVLSAFNSGAGTGGEVATLIYDDRVTGGNWVVVNVGSGGGGSGANVTLSNLTDPTAINQDLNMQGNSLALDADKDTYIESSTDDTLIMQVGGSSAITINNTNILTAKPISVLIGSINMNTNPINFQNTGQSIQSTSGGIIHSAPTSDTHGFAVNGDLKLSISGSSTTLTDNLVMSTNDITSIQNLEFSNNLSTPATNGTIYAQDVSGVRRVFVRTGNTTKDLTDIGSGSGGSGANTTLNNLGTTAINASLIPASNLGISLGSSSKSFNAAYILQTVGLQSIGMSTTGQSITSSGGGLQYNVPSSDTHIFGVNSGNQLQIGETVTYSGNTFVPSSDGAYALGASNLRWGGVWCDSADIDGIVNITGNVLCQGNVNLGNATTDIISLNGGVKIGSGTNNTIGFFGTTPIPQVPVSTSASLYTVIYALRAYGLFG
jgi:hypothetical protein